MEKMNLREVKTKQNKTNKKLTYSHTNCKSVAEMGFQLKFFRARAFLLCCAFSLYTGGIIKKEEESGEIPAR